jgi:chemotaxis response regulator CheB
MRRDGLDDCGQLKQTGGITFVQCQGNCVVYEMPKPDIEANFADRVSPLGKTVFAIVRRLSRSRWS